MLEKVSDKEFEKHLRANQHKELIAVLEGVAAVLKANNDSSIKDIFQKQNGLTNTLIGIVKEISEAQEGTMKDRASKLFESQAEIVNSLKKVSEGLVGVKQSVEKLMGVMSHPKETTMKLVRNYGGTIEEVIITHTKP